MSKILVLDIETTALDPRDGNIVEIGAVLLDTKTSEIEDKFHELIKEEKPFDRGAWIFYNSDLRPELVDEKGVKIESIRERLQKLFDSYTTIAYNYKFDFDWLESRGFKINRRGKDPMFIATSILRIPGGRNGGFKWPKVQECLNFYKIREIEPHRALGDARLEAKIVSELIKSGDYEVLESLALANDTEMQKLRYLAKIESYDHTIEYLNEKKQFCLRAIEKLEAK